ncbi:MAG: Fur family transcriptional regulator [Phycisphaerae bacterium]|nr:Fur family transcriptional regulator [Phycisphaerae bacterium]
MTDLEGKLERFCNRCRQNKLKITPQRVEVYKALISSNAHPSAEAVYDKVRGVLPNISLDTVNRTLNTLNEIGAAFVVAGSGDVKRFDGNLDNHQHFKCIKCRKIFDFHSEPLDNTETLRKLEEQFRVLRITVYAEGLCKGCIEKEQN